ncbi:MAG: hypothetical protein P8179_11980 [Candidatus Thiodiazotropha sp.]|jgi:hypothetical protein
MEKLSRREFVKGSGLFILKLGNTIMLGVIAYLGFYILKWLLNVTADGWLAIGCILLIFIGLYLLVIIINKFIEKYKSKYGFKAEANINALSITMKATLIGIFSAMGAKSIYQEREDNITMWLVLIVISIYHLFIDSRKKFL